MNPDGVVVVVASVAVTAGAALQRISGVGFATVSAAPLILLLGPARGVQMINGLAALCSFIVLLGLLRHVDRGRTLRITAAAVLATPVGVAVSLMLSATAVNLTMGAVMITALLAVGPLARWPALRRPAGSWGVGAVSGIANATVGQAGPLMAAYALATRWETTSYIASMQVCWLAANTVAVVLKGVPTTSPRLWALLGAAVVTGAVVGRIVAGRIPPRAAQRILFLIGLVGGSALIVGGLAGLVAG